MDFKKLNRKEKQRFVRRLKADNPGLDVVHPHAAGIDVGNASHYVAIPPTADGESVRQFGCCTADLRSLAEWLVQNRIQTVVMQSTGVYWIALYDILEQHGLEVFLVNAKYTKNLPGRKTDVQESQWLMKLHTYGLLTNSFRPPSEILSWRTYWRLRQEHVSAASMTIQRIQKVLTEMNVQLANVISDISGVSGMAILRAILDGERDPDQLANLCHSTIRASQPQVARSLEGNWRPELLFALQQQVQNYDHYQRQIQLCDQQLQSYVAALPKAKESAGARTAQPSVAKQRTKKTRSPKGNAPSFDLSSELHRVAGVDLTLIDGINVMTAQTLISEVGLDMSRWKTEAHFASWLGLCPDNRISGGVILGKGTRRVVNRAAIALRMSASTLIKCESYLGAQYRRLRTRLGAPKAITAMAHKLARIVYRMLKYGDGYIDKGADFYEKAFRHQQVIAIKKRAAKLGLQLVEA